MGARNMKVHFLGNFETLVGDQPEKGLIIKNDDLEFQIVGESLFFQGRKILAFPERHLVFRDFPDAISVLITDQNGVNAVLDLRVEKEEPHDSFMQVF